MRPPVFDFMALSLPARNLETEIWTCWRPGPAVPVVYLHGLGSSSRDFLGALDANGLPDHAVLALDFPGCGRSPYPRARSLEMNDLVACVVGALDRLDLPPAVLVGHSMGGLIGLLTSVRAPERVRALVNVEGNLAPDDCFFSRPAARWARKAGSSGYLDRLQAELRVSTKAAFPLYAERFRDEVRERAFLDYSGSIVRHSDGDPLLDWFLGLPEPRLFIHGSENRALAYLGRMRDHGVAVFEVPRSNHFPLYSNPEPFYRRLRSFLEVGRSRHGGDPTRLTFGGNEMH